MASSWVCATCKRRVPGYIGVCHCGAARPAAGVVTPTEDAVTATLGGRLRVDPRQVPWQVWLALGVMGLALLGGAVSLLFVQRQAQPTVPLLGYVDRVPAAAPQASPSASKAP